jgi:TRADD-N domain-containing protein
MLLVYLGLATMVGRWLGWFSVRPFMENHIPPDIFVAGGIIFVLIGLSIAMRSAASSKSEEDARLELKEAAKRLEQDIGDLKTLINANRLRIDSYEKVATYQAANSYAACQVAMFIGLAILSAGIIIALVYSQPSTQYAAAIVSAAGSAISAYIAKSFLDIQRSTMSQMRAYFRQAIVNNYVLTAERLAKDMSYLTRENTHHMIIGQLMAILPSDSLEGTTVAKGQPVDGATQEKKERISASSPWILRRVILR